MQYTVYWQPGCTSCLKLREFLKRHGVAFDSVNVREDARAADALLMLGARSIPVLARGDHFIHGQDLDEVARFLGVTEARRRLASGELAARLIVLLDAACEFGRQLGGELLEASLPGRPERHGADLVFHIAMIVEGLLAAAMGERLEYAFFEARPEGSDRLPDALRHKLIAVSARLKSLQLEPANRPLSTYYGDRSFLSVLERTTWHVAQHVRQLEALIIADGRTPVRPLGPMDLDGLPVPEAVWDPEVRADS
jgi:glutaredoxin